MVSRASRIPSGPDAIDVAYQRTIHRTNISGLATREDYAIAFAALARETQEEICGQVVFALALRNAGVSVAGIIEVGMCPPGRPLSPELRHHLENIAEVVDATGTQVLEMRECGGPGAERFTVAARQQYGILAVAYGDLDGSSVRALAWTPDGNGWKVSAFALEQATRHGWPRASYERLSSDLAGLLPGPDSEEIANLTADRPVAATIDGGLWVPWITYAEMADLLARQVPR